MDIHLLIKTLEATIRDQQKIISVQQRLNADQQKTISDQQRLNTDQQKTISDQQRLNSDQQKLNVELMDLNTLLYNRVSELESKLSQFTNKKNSVNSHIPPSQDTFRPKKNQSLRPPTDRKPGGQPGHEGSTFDCSNIPIDETIIHSPDYCEACGSDMSAIEADLIAIRKNIDIPPIVPRCCEHQSYKKQCVCGHTTVGDFPAHITSSFQYGTNIEALLGYLHARQYLPYKRTQEFLRDVLNLDISLGGLNNILNRFAQKCTPMYNAIKERIEQADVVGADETGCNVNGKNNWFWTWQNDRLTYIVASVSRGFQTIEHVFPNGLPNAILIHDRWPCHFKMFANGHQICTAHLLRDLNYIEQLYQNQCTWATTFKMLLLDAIELKKEFTSKDYYKSHPKVLKLFEQLDQQLSIPIDEEHKKALTFQKKLLAKRDSVLYFLLKPNVPPDNNGSERAIRNVKVKQKISGQFKSIESANVFAIIRSIIDTTLKSGMNVMHSLKLIALKGGE